MTDYDKKPDILLTDLIRLSDDLAYAELFKRYNRLLYIHAYKRLKDEQEAQDLIQDIFTNLWQKRRTLHIGDNVKAYLYTAVRNGFYNLVSQKQTTSVHLKSLQTFLDNQENIAITDHLVRENLFAVFIEKEISALPPRMRLVFELSRKNHLSHQQIADELGISVQTVTDQIKKALKILKPRLLPLIILIAEALK